MNEIKQVNDLFDNIFDDLDIRLRADDNLQDCRLFKQAPTTTYLPHVQMDLANTSKHIGNRDYTENKYPLDISLEIYTQNTPSIKRRELAKKIEEVIFQYLDNVVGLKLSFSRPVPILEERIHRQVMRFTGKYDIEQNIVYKE